MKQILDMESCAGSDALLRIVHNQVNDIFGVFVTDEENDTVCIAFNRSQMQKLAKEISGYLREADE